MPKVNHVKSARQRYVQIPVLDGSGQPKRSPMMRKGVQMKSKSGRPVTIAIMQNDISKPLPMPKCDHCDEEIKVGQPYKWIEPNGQRIRNRHEDCPTWKVWEYSSSLSARIAQIQEEGMNGFPDDATEESDISSFVEDLASQIRELAEEKRESASNIEDGFGHSTYQSDELNETADSLDEWAEGVEQVTLPDVPEAEETTCDTCGGSGEGEAQYDEEKDPEPCPDCEGTGSSFEAEEPSEEALQEWRDECRSAIEDALGNCPL